MRNSTLQVLSLIQAVFGSEWRTVTPIYDNGKFAGFNFGNGGGMTMPDGTIFNFGGGGGVYVQRHQSTHHENIPNPIVDVANIALSKTIDWSKVNFKSHEHSGSDILSPYHTFYGNKCLQFMLPDSLPLKHSNVPLEGGECLDGFKKSEATASLPPVLPSYKFFIVTSTDEDKDTESPSGRRLLEKEDSDEPSAEDVSQSSIWTWFRKKMNKAANLSVQAENVDVDKCDIVHLDMAGYCIETCVSPTVAKWKIWSEGLCKDVSDKESVDTGLTEIVVNRDVYASAPNVFLNGSMGKKVYEQKHSFVDEFKSIQKGLADLSDGISKGEDPEAITAKFWKLEGSIANMLKCDKEDNMSCSVHTLPRVTCDDCKDVSVGPVTAALLSVTPKTDCTNEKEDKESLRKVLVSVSNKFDDLTRRLGKCEDVNTVKGRNICLYRAIKSFGEALEHMVISEEKEGVEVKTKTKIYHINQGEECYESHLRFPVLFSKVSKGLATTLGFDKGRCEQCGDRTQLEDLDEGVMALEVYSCGNAAILAPLVDGSQWPLSDHIPITDNSRNPRDKYHTFENVNNDKKAGMGYLEPKVDLDKQISMSKASYEKNMRLALMSVQHLIDGSSGTVTGNADDLVSVMKKKMLDVGKSVQNLMSDDTATPKTRTLMEDDFEDEDEDDTKVTDIKKEVKEVKDASKKLQRDVQKEKKTLKENVDTEISDTLHNEKKKLEDAYQHDYNKVVGAVKYKIDSLVRLYEEKKEEVHGWLQDLTGSDKKSNEADAWLDSLVSNAGLSYLRRMKKISGLSTKDVNMLAESLPMNFDFNEDILPDFQERLRRKKSRRLVEQDDVDDEDKDKDKDKVKEFHDAVDKVVEVKEVNVIKKHFKHFSYLDKHLNRAGKSGNQAGKSGKHEHMERSGKKKGKEKKRDSENDLSEDKTDADKYSKKKGSHEYMASTGDGAGNSKGSKGSFDYSKYMAGAGDGDDKKHGGEATEAADANIRGRKARKVMRKDSGDDEDIKKGGKKESYEKMDKEESKKKDKEEGKKKDKEEGNKKDKEESKKKDKAVELPKGSKVTQGQVDRVFPPTQDKDGGYVKKYEKYARDVLNNNDMYCSFVKCPPNLPNCVYGLCVDDDKATKMLCDEITCKEGEKCVMVESKSNVLEGKCKTEHILQDEKVNKVIVTL